MPIPSHKLHALHRAANELAKMHDELMLSHGHHDEEQEHLGDDSVHHAAIKHGEEQPLVVHADGDDKEGSPIEESAESPAEEQEEQADALKGDHASRDPHEKGGDHHALVDELMKDKKKYGLRG